MRRVENERLEHLICSYSFFDFHKIAIMGRQKIFVGTKTILFLLFLHAAVIDVNGQDPCANHFSPTPPHYGSGNVVQLNGLFVDENEEEGTEVFFASWTAGGTPNHVPSGSPFDEYFEVVMNEEKTNWTVTLIKKLTGVPDVPSLLDTFLAESTFTGFKDYPECSYKVSITLNDENTQPPTFSKASYAVDVDEDKRVSTVVQMQDPVSITDGDRDAPNNQVVLTVDPECPLSPVTSDFDCSKGAAVEATFELSSPLDCETKPSYTCTLTITDGGDPSKQSTADLTVTVNDVPDENPVFDERFYQGGVNTIEPGDGGTVLDIKPQKINAVDGDVTKTTITYSMADNDPSVPGTDYFNIDSSTGDITYVKELDETILALDEVVFIVTATDANDQWATTVLLITLPGLPTTTTTTTTITTTTTEPDTSTSTVAGTSTSTVSPGTDETDESTPTTVSSQTTEPASSTSSSTSEATDSTTTTTSEGTEPDTSTGTPETPTVTPETSPGTPETPTLTPETSPGTAETPTVTPETSTVTPETPPVTPETSSTATETPPGTTPSPSDSLTFQQDTYSAYALPTFVGVILTVDVDVKGFDRDVVVFSKDGTDPSTPFEIASPSGEITIKNGEVPDAGFYSFDISAEADAPDGQHLEDTAKVNIQILTTYSENISLTESLHLVSLKEDTQERNGLFRIQNDGDEPIGSICIINVQPEGYGDYFKINHTDDNWFLDKIEEGIDFEALREHVDGDPVITFRIEALQDVVDQKDCQDKTTEEIFRNEALVRVTIVNVDDNNPVFVNPSSSSETIYYPRDLGLQKVVGPVITLQATDADGPEVKITYSITDGDDGFFIEPESGSIYLQDDFDCEDGCDLKVLATDDGGMESEEHTLQVKELGMSHIYTLTLLNTEFRDVDAALADMSKTVGYTIRKLYTNAEIKTIASQSRPQPLSYARRLRGYRSGSWSIDVNVYALDNDGQLVSMSDLNEKLSENKITEAVSFSDGGIFSPQESNGLVIAVAILGSLLGLILIAAAFVLIRRNRHHIAATARRITTLGKAYPEHLIESESDKRSTGNGYVNSSLGRTAMDNVQESLRSKRSSVMTYSETASTNGDLMSDGKVGLRRTDPGTPEYYGLSSKDPPPSYSKDETDTRKSSPKSYPAPLHPTTASNSSIAPSATTTYLSKYPKKSPPPLDTVPAKAILRGTEDIPLYTTNYQQKAADKPLEPERDYNEDENASWSSSRFTKLKGSPVMKKKDPESSAPPDGEDDRSIKSAGSADRTKGLLKHVKIATPGPDDYIVTNAEEDEEDDDGSQQDDVEDTTAEDDKKSVAFKVLVGMKIVETENKAPDRRAKEIARQETQADALEILEANRRKMQEEGVKEDADGDDDRGESNDEDEDVTTL